MGERRGAAQTRNPAPWTAGQCRKSSAGEHLPARVTIPQAGQQHTEAELLSGCLTLFMVHRGFRSPPGLLQAKRITRNKNTEAQATRALKTHECPLPSKFNSAGCSSQSMANKTNAAFVLVLGKHAKKTSTRQSS